MDQNCMEASLSEPYPFPSMKKLSWKVGVEVPEDVDPEGGLEKELR